ncbi:electron transport complex subunit RsxC [Shewanella psychrotolerans]|uniref:electron transport complex subunit RsxC n=1 Tax=Shewanella psychrotolerans TaxID=2864206 RepID=UPI001C65900F|nr:electron transport complex subunit RsxC [Shewanella psychrotolerans]QYJ99919.1 electron transport complex subunit RsxC [Shewanella psychrotolerans]
MLALFEQIDKGTLWQIPGGIHPPEFKTLSSQSPISRLPHADRLIVPIPHVGENCTLGVNVGDVVDKGQPLTVGDGFRHLPVHAPVSGTVVAIEEHPSNHASGLPVMCCVIENDHQQRLACSVHARLSRNDVQQMSSQEILTRVQNAGIAGLGGAAFPTHIKLKPASDIELLIINGVECEPYITSDDLLMQQHSDDIVTGIEIIHQLLSPKRIIIAIEDNKPQAIEQMNHALNRSALPSNCARVTAIPTLYPSGGEKQLIQILTGLEVPSGSIPAHLGILVQNVGTAFSIEQAVYSNIPLIERVVTLTGNNIAKPGNYWVPIGTPINHLLDSVQFKGDSDSPVIIGGPMMGYMLPNWNAPITKGTNCLLMPSKQEIAPQSPEQPCIRCGECAVVCPAQLLPQQLFWHAKAQEYDKAASYNLRDCIECGCCSYVCPSDIPLVEYYRVAKSALKQEAEEKKQAELAKQRFDSRTLRLEQEKHAREEKAKQAAERRKTQMTGSDKDAVASAMARIKAKKAAQEQTQTPGPTQTEAIAADSPVNLREVNPQEVKPQDKVAAAIARAKAKKAAQKAEAESTAATESSVTLASGDSSTAASTQKEKVAAAIARAKAKKAAQQQSPAAEIDQEPAQTDKQTAPLSQQEKVAAAIARAKAKKAQQTGLTEQSREALTDTAAPIDDAEAIKKAKIAAAVAKAKAKKAQQAGLNQEQTVARAEQATDESPVMADKPVASVGPVDDAEAIKKAKIAAAVAKAKAKKAQQAGLNQEQTVVSVEQATDETPVMADKPVASVAPVDDAAALKKAKIAAAVAKAKAKKLAKAQADNSTNEHKD